MAADDGPPPRVIYLARHGETDWNRAGRWQGHTDIALNENGVEQAHAVADALQSAGLASIVSSDLSRAAETARIVGDSLGLPVAYVDRQLRERSFGCFEGLTARECELHHPEAWRAWTLERRPPLGAEPPTAVVQRVAAAVARAATHAAGAGPVLIVSHGGAMRAAISPVAQILGPIANGAIWRLEWDQAILAAEPLAPLPFHRPSC